MAILHPPLGISRLIISELTGVLAAIAPDYVAPLALPMVGSRLYTATLPELSTLQTDLQLLRIEFTPRNFVTLWLFKMAKLIFSGLLFTLGLSAAAPTSAPGADRLPADTKYLITL